ncbi:MAG: RNA methyltransferase, partial [Clostridiales bacterium]
MEITCINSKDNQYIKLARSLGQKKTREEQGLFVVEGLRLAEEAVAYGADIRFGLFRQDAVADPRVEMVAASCLARGIRCYQIPDQWLNQISQTAHSQGLLLVAAIPAENKGTAVWAAADFVVVLDQLADPGNLGTIIRTAHAAGAGAVLLTPGCADIYNPKTVRAAMGALFKLPVIAFTDQITLVDQLRREGRIIYAAAAGGTDLFRMRQLRFPLAWVMGAEATGVSDFWLEAAADRIGLPMTLGAESLNVA